MKAIILQTVVTIFISVLVSLTTYHLTKQKSLKIVTLDMQAIINDYVVEQSQGESSEEELQENVENFAYSLELLRQEIEALALEGGFIVLPTQTVISGAEEVTEQVKVLMAEIQEKVGKKNVQKN